MTRIFILCFTPVSMIGGNIIDNCGLLDVTFAELQTIPHDKVEDILLCGKKISELNADYLEDKVAYLEALYKVIKEDASEVSKKKDLKR